MTARLRIDRCIVHAVRRGGWSWGADRQQLVEAIRRLVPLLVARHLADCWPGDAVAEVSAPIRLTVSLGSAELSRFMARAGDPNAPRVDADLEARVEDAVRAAVARAVAETAHPREKGAAAAETAGTPGRRVGVETAFPLLALMARWHRAGELVARLRAAPRERLDAWHGALRRASLDGSYASGMTPIVESDVASSVAPEMFTIDDDPQSRALRFAMLSAVDVFSRAGRLPRLEPIDAVARPDAASTPGSDRSRSVADHDVGPAMPAGDGDVHDATASEEAAASATTPLDHPRHVVRSGVQSFTAARRRATAAASGALREERHIVSALPFLILGPLSRMGYLDALAATCDAAGRLADVPLAGAALAYKVLGSPARGWRRDAADQIAAATVAGLDAPIEERAIAQLAADLAPHLTIADDELMRALMQGHATDRPMLLQRTEGADNGYLLTEIDGIFPVAWRSSVPGFADIARELSGVTLLVPALAACGDALAAIDAWGWRFITDAPAGRDEPWRALRQLRSPRLWTNDYGTPASELFRQGHLLQAVAERTGECWGAVAIKRPSAVQAGDRTFDRSLTLAATVALADIAWTLWRDRETTDPLLPLMRFADFDARVRFGEDLVHVRVPLGRRHQDLRDHGLLRDVARVPWLDGRTLRFGGG